MSLVTKSLSQTHLLSLCRLLYYRQVSLVTAPPIELDDLKMLVIYKAALEKFVSLKNVLLTYFEVTFIKYYIPRPTLPGIFRTSVTAAHDLQYHTALLYSHFSVSILTPFLGL